MRKFLAILSLSVLLCACSKVVYLDQDGNKIEPPKEEERVEYLSRSDERFEIIERIGYSIDEIRDVKTGVHYYCFNYSKYGNGITPVYLSDGSIKVTGK